MKHAFLLYIGFLAFGVPLQAGTSYNLDFNTTSSAGLIVDSGYAVSPYTGTLNGTALALYCDDFNDNVNYGQQNITAYSTALPTTTNTAFQNDTRYGVANPTSAGANYPAGTQLYQEMAWLATQMQNTTGANATYNDAAIQEAIWTLTDDKHVNDGQSPQNQTTTGTGTVGDGGAQQSYSAWISDAAADYNRTGVTGYTNLTISDWYIVTAVSSAGCTLGSNGTTGCTPGTAGTGTVTQEFLGYSTGLVSTTNSSSAATPEPASFVLIGSGLLAAAFVRRRRAKADKAR